MRILAGQNRFASSGQVARYRNFRRFRHSQKQADGQSHNRENNYNVVFMLFMVHGLIDQDLNDLPARRLYCFYLN